MTYKIPDTFFGIKTDEAMKRVLAKEKTKVPDISPVQESSKEGFIYVPSIKLYVAKEKTLHGKNYYETQKQLHKNNNKMLTPYEFFEFIKYLKKDYQDKNEAGKILDEILAVRNPLRAEWLDHDYKKESNGLYVLCHKYNNQGKIEPVKELLDKSTLMKDKNPGIDLEDLLNEKTSQGLPKSNIREGSLYYWHPRSDNNSVARFDANSDGAGLGCARGGSV